MQNAIVAISPSRPYGVMVSTLDFESTDPSSNLGGTFHFTAHQSEPFMPVMSDMIHGKSSRSCLCSLKIEVQVRDDNKPVGRSEAVDQARRRGERPGSQTKMEPIHSSVWDLL